MNCLLTDGEEACSEYWQTQSRTVNGCHLNTVCPRRQWNAEGAQKKTPKAVRGGRRYPLSSWLKIWGKPGHRLVCQRSRGRLSCDIAIDDVRSDISGDVVHCWRHTYWWYTNWGFLATWLGCLAVDILTQFHFSLWLVNLNSPDTCDSVFVQCSL